MRPPRDKWAHWLLVRRHGGDAQAQQRYAGWLAPVRDRVLDGAHLQPGDCLLDVGAGDGLIAFGALERVGPSGRVIFSDISPDLLSYCQTRAMELGVLERCQFIQASAEDLMSVQDASVDAVTTRSVLIYVADKLRAFREFRRVLRDGGRLSIFEPINSYFDIEGRRWWPYDVPSSAQALVERVWAVYRRIQPPTDPMLDFGDRDLVQAAEAAGFGPIHLELLVDVEPMRPMRWEVFLNQSGNPLVPTHAEAMRQALSPGEVERLEAVLRPLVEQGRGTNRRAVAYLRAIKNG